MSGFGAYRGINLPKWFQEGLKLQVRDTPILRRHGMAVETPEGRSTAYPGEIATVRVFQGDGWWDWVLEFKGKRTVRLSDAVLVSVRRIL